MLMKSLMEIEGLAERLHETLHVGKSSLMDSDLVFCYV